MALTSFPEEITKTWTLFRDRFLQVITVGAASLLPLVLIVPYLAESYVLREQAIASGILDATTLTPSILTSLFALAGMLGTIITSIYVKAALYEAFGDSKQLSTRTLLKNAAKKFFPFLGTYLLSLLIIAIGFLPPLIIAKLYGLFIRPVFEGLASFSTIDGIVLVSCLTLFLLGAIVALLVGFAPIAFTLGDAKAGIPAIQKSIRLVRPQFWRIAKRMFAWLFVMYVISSDLSILPIARWILPTLLGIFSVGFFVRMYKEIR